MSKKQKNTLKNPAKPVSSILEMYVQVTEQGLTTVNQLTVCLWRKLKLCFLTVVRITEYRYLLLLNKKVKWEINN